MTDYKTDPTLLPPLCAARLRDKADGHRVGTPIFIREGETGYFRADEDDLDVDAWNASQGITVAQREAMEFGSMFGWDTPGAEPATWMTPQNVLRHAAEMLQQEGAWVQGVLARNKDGSVVPPENWAAVCWCAAGAISAATVRLCGSAHSELCFRMENGARDLMKRQIGAMHSTAITLWNDAGHRMKGEVVTEMRKAAQIGCTKPETIREIRQQAANTMTPREIAASHDIPVEEVRRILNDD